MLYRNLAFACTLFASAVATFGQGINPARRATDATETPQSSDRYFIEFRTWGAHGPGAVRAAGGQVVHEFPGLKAVAAHLPPQAAQALQRNPAVNFVEVDPPRYMMATGSAVSGQTEPYGIAMVQADQLTIANPANRKVCIIDSGYYLGHEDLQTTSVTGNSDPSAGVWYRDGFGHGTHVAGTIAALTNTKGVVGVVGAGGYSGLVQLHIVRVFGDSGTWAYSSDLVAALQQCRDAGANVVSMSLGGSFPSRVENNAFANAYNAGVLSVAAAGNDGNNRKSYPASYDSVISVAAIDSTMKVAGFSQKNNAVELAAPGVAVLSTLPYIDTDTITVGKQTYSGTWIEFSARTSSRGLTGTLVDGGLCDSVGSWSGKLVVCQRGSISFYDKVANVQTGGGTGAIIYNNVSGGFDGTLGDGNTSSIPAIGLSMEDGQLLLASIGQQGALVSYRTQPASGYAAWDGTSMATPHVSGVAALIWSYNPNWTNAQIRQAMQATAKDLGAPGRDTSYGYGLVQAAAALQYLRTNFGGY